MKTRSDWIGLQSYSSQYQAHSKTEYLFTSVYFSTRVLFSLFKTTKKKSTNRPEPNKVNMFKVKGQVFWALLTSRQFTQLGRSGN